MAKRGFTNATVRPVLRDRAADRGWALCVGAGTSQPLFPSWDNLVRRLIKKDVSEERLPATFGYVNQRFSPDALIQAALDRLDIDSQRFARLLSKELYLDIDSALNREEWSIFSRVLATDHIGNLNLNTWQEFKRITDTHLSGLSATDVANVFYEARQDEVEPDAILSFNAEPLLFSLIHNQIAIEEWGDHKKAAPPDALAKLTHSISTRRPSRVPYYFCHGLLPIPGYASAHSAEDKLVFSETSYLQLANTSFSWQSTTFLNNCMSKSVVFVGVSLSDPNMRRWLTWVHSNRKKEIAQFGNSGATSAIHYWLAEEPDTADQKRWVESAVAHLGIRVVWLNNWRDIGEVLRKMLGLT